MFRLLLVCFLQCLDFQRGKHKVLKQTKLAYVNRYLENQQIKHNGQQTYFKTFQLSVSVQRTTKGS